MTNAMTSRAFLLKQVSWDAWEQAERRLAFEADGPAPAATLVLCEHPARFLVGREGSRNHLPACPESLQARGFPVQWVARGGGVQLLQPGQVVVHFVCPLGPLGLTLHGFVSAFTLALARLIESLGMRCEPRDSAVWVGDRAVATHGTAVRHGVASALGVVNVAPDLELFHQHHRHARPRPATSVARETPALARPGLVRQRLLDTIRGGLPPGVVDAAPVTPCPPTPDAVPCELAYR